MVNVLNVLLDDFLGKLSQERLRNFLFLGYLEALSGQFLKNFLRNILEEFLEDFMRPFFRVRTFYKIPEDLPGRLSGTLIREL